MIRLCLISVLFFLSIPCFGDDFKRSFAKKSKSNLSNLTSSNYKSASPNYVLKDKYSKADIEEKISKSVAYSDCEEDYSGYYKVGQPYEIKGVTYYPQEYENYEEVGQASWYGSDFHGKVTANGEVYNMNDMTAAHRTLPLPSMVKVTNLDNGKSAIVRINDRGPFSSKRVIDLSESVADELDFKSKGIANVKVQFLGIKTKTLLSKLNLKSCQSQSDCSE